MASNLELSTDHLMDDVKEFIKEIEGDLFATGRGPTDDHCNTVSK